MNLLIDIGNSRLKWANEQAGCGLSVTVVDYRQTGYLADLREIWRSLTVPEHLLVASVAESAVTAEVLDLANSLWPHTPTELPLAAAQAFGVTNAYQNPEKLGIDRWLALLAAHHYYPGSCCIVDCGTALTIDLINADGLHLGGLICPGLMVMKKALLANTAALEFERVAPQLMLADTTAAAIDNGVLAAGAGCIEAIVSRLEPTDHILLCGGDASLLAGQLNLNVQIDADLVFKGLSIVAAGKA
ncbi:type III pantothenate kinase [Methylomonas paludis]|uniref:Type III pantothenate kinase n=1 Tax=Methylomonas paludis TaxID=1173101 RepID=A0A975MKV4_9GAMM|nr:type III pantothenate kinase [Methylomonas paludis]QWF69642.1 type III pantothenate kinase [Methylomonas paludis]